jgi:two-component system LytT family response regulator
MPDLSHTYTTVIADDEEPARRRIRELLEKEQDIRILEICKNGEQAIKSVHKHQPDILFLDIQMPEIDGFDVLKKLQRERIPVTIFVTAYDQYALQAFEVHAVDYLLKPYSDERFSEALKRAKKLCEMENRESFHNRLDKLLSTNTEESPHNRNRNDSLYIDRMVLEKNGKKFFLDVHEIRWIEASGSYIYVHTEEKKYIKRMLLGNLEKQLNPRFFIRIHRSAVVHLDAIESLHHHSHGDYKVTLSGGKELKLSRNYRVNLQNRLGQQL